MSIRRRTYSGKDEELMRRYRIIESWNEGKYRYVIMDSVNKNIVHVLDTTGYNFYMNIIGDKYYIFSNLYYSGSTSGVFSLDTEGNKEILGTLASYSIAGYPFSVNGEFYGLIGVHLDTSYNGKNRYPIYMINNGKLSHVPTSYIELIKNGVTFTDTETFKTIKILYQDSETEEFALGDLGDDCIYLASLDINSLKMTISGSRFNGSTDEASNLLLYPSSSKIF